jgi:hypothetical protein
MRRSRNKINTCIPGYNWCGPFCSGPGNDKSYPGDNKLAPQVIPVYRAKQVKFYIFPINQVVKC